jgi:hypothetical protein
MPRNIILGEGAGVPPTPGPLLNMTFSELPERLFIGVLPC